MGVEARRLTIIASFDLGGSLPDAKGAIAALRDDARFAGAHESATFMDRMQDSYRFSQEPTIVAAAERVELDLPSWQGEASQRISVHPAGVITFALELAVEGVDMDTCALIEREVYDANVVLYRPYLKEKFGSALETGIDESAAHRGIGFIAPMTRIRELLAAHARTRPKLYPAFDARVVVGFTSDQPVEAVAEDLVSDYASSRETSARAPVFEWLKCEHSPIHARMWKGLLYAACDPDACLLVGADDERIRTAADCIEAAHQMWFLARLWVGVLDEIGTVEVSEADLSEETIGLLEQDVVALSAIEFQIARSMVTVESAGIMLRAPWQAELIDRCLKTYDVAVQQRLIAQRLNAVDRNHATAAEILARADEKLARGQANQLQLLFSVAVAAAIAAIIPATGALSGRNAGEETLWTWGVLAAVWLLLVFVIVWVGRYRVGGGRRRIASAAAQPAAAAEGEPPAAG